MKVIRDLRKLVLFQHYWLRSETMDTIGRYAVRRGEAFFETPDGALSLETLAMPCMIIGPVLCPKPDEFVFEALDMVAQQVRMLIVARLGDQSAITIHNLDPDTTLDREGIGYDSLDQVELVMELERHFGFDIPDDDAEKLSTVALCTEYVRTKQ